MLGRTVGICIAVAGAIICATSCAQSEDGVFSDNELARDAGNDTSSGTGGSIGGSGGEGFGGTGGGGFGGVGGDGATGGAGVGGTTGVGGSEGTGGNATGGTGGGGSCNPAFCPNSGVGQPCCVTPNGPCGSDTGAGCVTATQDF